MPVGCVIVDVEEKIIGYGYNSSIKNNDPTSRRNNGFKNGLQKKKKHIN